jgi:hypothetical protein
VRSAAANASRWRGQAGHYEAWHLRLADPASSATVWIRLAFHAPMEGAGEPLAEVWFVGRDTAGSLYARRETFAIDSFSTGAGGFPVTLGRCRLDESGASGSVDEAAWDLHWDAGGGEVGYGGESRIRRTEIVTTQPAIVARGRLSIAGQQLDVRAWPGHQLHAWGDRHADVSARVHCNAFPERGAYIEAVTRRYGQLGAATPAVTLGSAHLAGRRFEARNTVRGVVSSATVAPDHYEFRIRGIRARLEGRVSCDPSDMVGVSYKDPDGTRVFAYQADRGSMEAKLLRRTPRGWTVEAQVEAAGCCAYEYASRKPVAGVPVVL